MNQCYGCTTCSSADKPLEGFIRSLPTDLAVLHRNLQEESVAPTQTQLSQETF